MSPLQMPLSQARQEWELSDPTSDRPFPAGVFPFQEHRGPYDLSEDHPDLQDSESQVDTKIWSGSWPQG